MAFNRKIARYRNLPVDILQHRPTAVRMQCFFRDCSFRRLHARGGGAAQHAKCAIKEMRRMRIAALPMDEM